MTDARTDEPGTRRAYRLLDLPSLRDPRGALHVVEPHETVPFDIRRVYYISDVPSGARRAGHAHRLLEELVIVATGACRAVLDDGSGPRTLVLDRPDRALYIPPLVWHELGSFSPETLVLGIASRPYEPDDYLNEYEAFLAAARARS